MTVRFNSHLTSIPGYTPGVPKGHSAEDVAGSDLAQLASNESPYPPLPEVVERGDVTGECEHGVGPAHRVVRHVRQVLDLAHDVVAEVPHDAAVQRRQVRQRR